MKQLSKPRSILYHLYPGLFILLGFILFAPAVARNNYPPQIGLLLSIIIVAIPVLVSHLLWAKKKEGAETIMQLNGFTNKLSNGKLALYVAGLVIFAFVIWGLTEPLNKMITDKFFSRLPEWFTAQDFSRYDKQAIELTLILNLILNGFLAPFFEELYFRGYLLSRMKTWGKSAPFVNAVLFSLYHFWQPYIYLTLILSLLPMAYFVWKTKDIRVGIYTHCLLNVIGALLSFGLLLKK